MSNNKTEKKIIRLKLSLSSAAKKHPAFRKLMMGCIKTVKRKKYVSYPGELRKTLDRFVPADKRQDSRYIRKLADDIFESWYVDLVSPGEYFLFDFANLSQAERDAFVGIREGYMLAHAIRGKDWAILLDKNASYEKFKRFYRREALAIRSREDRDAFYAFVKKHGSAIVKDACGCKGKGTGIVHDDRVELDAVWQSISGSLTKKNTSYIAEELIVQSDEMARFHPNSVNTVRLMTFRKDGEVLFLGGLFRMGCGGSVVDNVGSGGILAELDVKTGRVIGSAMAENGEKIDVHPDTGVRITDYQIPRWEELLDFCRELASVLKDQYYTGWDCALTDDGWVMVEGNSAAVLGGQYVNKRGLRRIIEETFYDVLKNEKSIDNL